MRQVAEKANGAQIYADHADWYPVVRKIEHLLGKLENVTYHEATKEVRGDAVLLAGELGDKVLAVAEKMPEMLGFSIVAEGLQEEQDGQIIVTEVVRLESVDVVTKPATVTSLFESIQPKLEAEDDPKDEPDDEPEDDTKDDLEKENEELRAKIKELEAEIEDLKADKAASEEKAKEAATAEAFRAAGLDPAQNATLFEFLKNQPAELRSKAIAELQAVTARAQTGLPAGAQASAIMGGKPVAESTGGSVQESDVDTVVKCFRS